MHNAFYICVGDLRSKHQPQHHALSPASATILYLMLVRLAVHILLLIIAGSLLNSGCETHNISSSTCSQGPSRCGTNYNSCLSTSGSRICGTNHDNSHWIKGRARSSCSRRDLDISINTYRIRPIKSYALREKRKRTTKEDSILQGKGTRRERGFH